VDGDHIVVGSPNIGVAYVFECGVSCWPQTQSLTPSDNIADGWFGWDVDLRGDAIVLGTVGHTSGKEDAVCVLCMYLCWMTNMNGRKPILSPTGSDQFGDTRLSVLLTMMALIAPLLSSSDPKI
jgi:hypothetical protein